MRRYRAALAGYYGFGNLGDELLAEAAVSALLRAGVGRDQIVVMSNNPEESRLKLGVDAVNRWKAAEVCRALRQSDTLLLGGGGLFQDASSLLSCFYYWLLVRTARFYGTVAWALGQSVGPLSTLTGRVLTRDALKRCRVLQVRDAASEALCASLGLTVERGTDLVLSEADVFEACAREKAPSRLLVNLRPDSRSAPNMAERFARAISAYSASFDGEIVGIALSDEDEKLMKCFASKGALRFSRVERVLALGDAVKLFRGTAAVGMRLHFVILAALARIPLAVAPYDPKVEAFAEEWNIPIWRGENLPALKAASFPSDFSPQRVQESIDVLCGKIFSNNAPDVERWRQELRLYENDETDLIADYLEATIFNNKLLSDPKKRLEVEFFLKLLQDRDIAGDSSLSDKKRRAIHGVMEEAKNYLKDGVPGTPKSWGVN
jgi:polysaccharide pyruvyl transferase CsaB